MTEQDYEKLVEDAAEKFESTSAEVNDYADVFSFKAGAKWARANPAPEVLGLVEALEAVIEGEGGDPGGRSISRVLDELLFGQA